MLCGLTYVQTFYKDYIEKQIENTFEKDQEWADFRKQFKHFLYTLDWA